MEENPALLSLPADAPAVVAAASEPQRLPTWLAVTEVILVCGVPTQLVVGTLLAIAVLALRLPVRIINTDGAASLEFLAMVMFFDTALVCLLIRAFLGLSGESSTEVFIGRRPVAGEVLRGLISLPVVLIVVSLIVAGLRAIAPWTHNVAVNPFNAYLHTRTEAAVFGFMVVLAGGVREELQRGFILHRFAQRLGGIRVGLAIYTIVFGLLHLAEGVDAAVAVCLLGLFWGLLYMRRRSVVWAMTNHASFDLAQVLQAVLTRSFAG